MSGARRALRGQRGFTMIEVLVAMTLSVVVLGITVTAFISLLDEDRTVTEHNEAQEQSRIAMQRLAHDLRNLANPTELRTVTANRPRAIDRAGSSELVARIVDERPPPAGSLNQANVMRVRWCLNTDDPSNAVLWQQTQRWTTAEPPDPPPPSACPGPQWDTRMEMARHLSNATGTVTRPLFSFNSTLLEQISKVHADLYVDPTPARSPREVRLSSGVHLRNQNQYPVGSFEIVPIGTSGSNQTLRFDGSGSTDPEGQALRYCWFVDPPTPTPPCGAVKGDPPSFVGEGIVLEYSMSPGTHRVVLRVTDPAGLRDDKEKTWTVPQP